MVQTTGVGWAGRADLGQGSPWLSDDGFPRAAGVGGQLLLPSTDAHCRMSAPSCVSPSNRPVTIATCFNSRASIFLEPKGVVESSQAEGVPGLETGLQVALPPLSPHRPSWSLAPRTSQSWASWELDRESHPTQGDLVSLAGCLT